MIPCLFAAHYGTEQKHEERNSERNNSVSWCVFPHTLRLNGECGNCDSCVCGTSLRTEHQSCNFQRLKKLLLRHARKLDRCSYRSELDVACCVSTWAQITKPMSAAGNFLQRRPRQCTCLLFLYCAWPFNWWIRLQLRAIPKERGSFFWIGYLVFVLPGLREEPLLSCSSIMSSQSNF